MKEKNSLNLLELMLSDVDVCYIARLVISNDFDVRHVFINS